MLILCCTTHPPHFFSSDSLHLHPSIPLIWLLQSVPQRAAGDVFVLRLTYCTPVIYISAPLPLSFSLLLCVFLSHSLLPPCSSCSLSISFLCTSAHTNTHTHTHKEVAPSLVKPSVEERSLILSQREWACWGIREGMWVV